MFDPPHTTCVCAYSTGGATNTQDALRVLVDSVFTPPGGDRPSARDVAVIITDGRSNVDSNRTVPAADTARRAGIELFGVAVGDDPDTAEIDAIADRPVDGHVISGLVTSADVASVADRLIGLLCGLRG